MSNTESTESREEALQTEANEAKLAILRSIKAHASGSTSSVQLTNLAEAYAWVVAPSQSHGASTDVSVKK
ncbi:MAG TPA: hypothetical protein VNO31_35495 [Umezawaea sp.]|nr:hypothetical protein [Umezawaea sp.]